MLLIRRVAKYLRRPFFEVMQFPLAELDLWALSFHIDDNGVDDVIEEVKKEEASVEESIEAAKRFLYG